MILNIYINKNQKSGLIYFKGINLNSEFKVNKQNDRHGGYEKG